MGLQRQQVHGQVRVTAGAACWTAYAGRSLAAGGRLVWAKVMLVLLQQPAQAAQAVEVGGSCRYASR